MKQITSLADAPAVLEEFWPTRKTLHRMDLERMQQLMDALGNPQEKYKAIHIAGTSGKTSTAYYTAALLTAAGKKVGLTVSPHVTSVNERVQIGMVPLPEPVFVAEMNEFLGIVEQTGLEPMYFELLCAFAFWEFARQDVEYAVVEVGVGGLLDNTNVMHRADKVCILTDIGYDHMSVLGNTLAQIATQKAGIIQLHNAVFCWEQEPEILAVFHMAARQQQADFHTLQISPHLPGIVQLPLFQRRNFALAYQTVQYVLGRDGGTLDKDVVSLAMHTHIPARMEQWQIGGKTVIADAAHNPQKLHALMESVRDKFPEQKVAVLAGFTNSKTPANRNQSGARELAQDSAYIILTSFTVNRLHPHNSMKPETIAATFDAVGYTAYQIIPDPALALEALLARPEPVLVIAGSFYLLNSIRPLLISLAADAQ